MLDDFATADSVCMECGLVLEQILGHGGERERVRGANPDEWSGGGEGNVCYVAGERLSAARVRRERTKETVLRPILAPFHLDNDYVLERVCDNYEKIYGGRPARKGFKKTIFKKQVAVAFSIINTLSRLHMPRPVEDVLLVCGVRDEKSNSRALLDVVKTLNLSEQELAGLNEEDYELADADPEDYVDVICAQLCIPFAVASTIHEIIAEARWMLYGHFPTVIIAAAIQQAVAKRPHLAAEAPPQRVCQLLNCRQETVNRLLPKIDRLQSAQ